MKHTKFLLITLSLILVLVLASCNLIHQCDFGEEWKYDEENHWLECECGKQDKSGAHAFGEWVEGETEKARECEVCGYRETAPIETHEHNYSDKWLKDGEYHWHACSGCNVPADKAAHEWGEGEVITPATEEAEGLMKLTCAVCEATKEEVIPKLEHTHKFAEGWTSDETHHWHATTCGHEDVEGKAEHEWDNGVQTKAPSCDEAGIMTFTCATCGATKTEEIAKNGHSYAEEWIIDDNQHWHVCGVCGEKGSLEDHSFDSGTVAEGKVIYTCVCGRTMENSWDGTTVSESLIGSGTEDDPYLIQSGADFAYIKQHMTAEGDNFAGIYFKMIKNIDLGNHSMKIGQYPGWNADRRFFAGIFDGNNCTVINLNMTESGMGGGLFSVLTGTVKNLTVYGTVKGDNNMVGGIVGWLYTGTLENCTNYVNVTSTAPEAGALVGTSEWGIIKNCVNYGSVIGTDSVGSIAGKASGTIENCVNNGAAYGCSNVGGIYGSQHHTGAPTLTNNVDNGTAEIKHVFTHYEAVEATCETAGNVEYYACSVCNKNYNAEGNIVSDVVIGAKGHEWDNGVAAGSKITFTCGNCGTTRVEDAKYTVTVNYLFLDGTVAAEADIIEFNYEEFATVNAKTIDGYVPNKNYVKVEVLENITVNIYYSELSVWDGITVSESLSGSGTAEDPYLIQSAADLAYLDKNATNIENFKDVYFKMTKSIDLNGHSMKIGEYPGWGGRKIFFGIFDGNNCAVINLNMTESGMGGGLFAVVSGTVKNLSVYGTVKGDNNMVGGIVGWLYNGTLDNCTGYVTVTSTAPEVGALVGTSENGTILNCVNYGSVLGNDSIGCIAGKASGRIENCINYGTAVGCYNVATIYGSKHNSGTPALTNNKDYGTAETKHTLGHHEAVEATCETAGNVEYYACSVCNKNFDAEGNVISNVIVDAKGHAWDDGVLSEGKKTYTCGTCGTIREEVIYTVTVNHLYIDGSRAFETEVIEVGNNTRYTVNAKTLEGYVASHDYVMGDMLGENQTVAIYYSEVSVWDGTSISTSLAGTGTEADPYLIQSAADLAYFAKVINEHNVDGTFTKDHTSREVYTVYAGVYFKLTKSIDLNGNLLKIGYSLAWNNYSRFGGTFDGNNCSVRGINITAAETNRNDALFGVVYAGTIKNLSTYGSVYGGGVLNGGVVGYVVSGTVENCTSYVNIEGAKETGGIVGNLEKGTVKNCVNYGNVKSSDAATGGVIVGKNASGTITNSVSYTELNAQ